MTVRKGAPPAGMLHKVEEAVLDEMWSLVGSKHHPRWQWEELDQQAGRMVASTFGRRADRALLQLKA
jgi:insertion element IS1 protein InsB